MYDQPPEQCMLSHLIHVQIFATPWTVAHQAPLSMGFPKQEYWSGLPCSPPGHLPNIRVFSDVSVLRLRWPNYWSFNISPSNEYSGLISFRTDCFDLLAVQGTLKRSIGFYFMPFWDIQFSSVQSLSHVRLCDQIGRAHV